jgi:undecaprenyl diphosphate synthase
MAQANNLALPTHVGLILDGNRRWAKDQGLPALEGHRVGYGNLKEIAKYAVNKGVSYISAYIFSTENWNRSKEEVSYLLDLALWVATREVREVHKEGIRVRFLGGREGLSDKLLKAIQKAEELTKNNIRGTLALCFNYGGQQEIVDAAKKLIGTAQDADAITLEKFANALYTPDIPAIDLIIRTSGEQRLSNFMLWRAAYAELYFVKKHWPAFTVNDFDEALAEFASRQRRFGN